MNRDALPPRLHVQVTARRARSGGGVSEVVDCGVGQVHVPDCEEEGREVRDVRECSEPSVFAFLLKAVSPHEVRPAEL